MDSDNKSSILITLIAAISAIVIVATPAACMVHETYTLGQLIKAGSYPIAARCALGAGTSQTLCALSVQKASKP